MPTTFIYIQYYIFSKERPCASHCIRKPSCSIAIRFHFTSYLRFISTDFLSLWTLSTMELGRLSTLQALIPDPIAMLKCTWSAIFQYAKYQPLETLLSVRYSGHFAEHYTHVAAVFSLKGLDWGTKASTITFCPKIIARLEDWFGVQLISWMFDNVTLMSFVMSCHLLMLQCHISTSSHLQFFSRRYRCFVFRII